MWNLQVGTARVHALGFSPDGDRLAVASGDFIAVVDWRAPAVPVWQESRGYGSARTLAFDPDGVGFVAGFEGHGVVRYGAEFEYYDPDSTYQLVGMERLPPCVAAVQDSAPRVVVQLGYEAVNGPDSLFVHPFPGGPAVARLPKRVTTLPYGVGTYPRSPRHPHVNARHDDPPRAAWATGGSRLLVWSSRFLRWYPWPPPTEPSPAALPVLELLAEVEAPFAAAESLYPLPDGDTVLVAHRGSVLRWYAPTATTQVRWRWPGMQSIRSVAVSRDGTVAAAGANGGRVVVWDLDG